MEVGRYIDFHTTSESSVDYDVRIKARTDCLTSTGVTRGTFSGNVTGNATKLQAARTINGVSFDGIAVLLEEVGKVITYYIVSFSEYASEELRKTLLTPKLCKLANKFHRVDERSKIFPMRTCLRRLYNMYKAEISWHEGKNLKLISGTCNDGNRIARILKNRIEAERKQIRIENYLEAYIQYEKKTARTAGGHERAETKIQI